MGKPDISSTSFGANITPTYWSASQILGHSHNHEQYRDNNHDYDYHEHEHNNHHAEYPHNRYFTYHNQNHTEVVEDILDYGSDLVDEALAVSTSDYKSDLNISSDTSFTLPMLEGGHHDFVQNTRQTMTGLHQEHVVRNISQV